METDELIAALAADATPAKRPKLLVRTLLGAICAAVLVIVLWGIRPNLGEALGSGTVQAKHLYTLLLLVGTSLLMVKTPLGQPIRLFPIWIVGAAIAVMWAGAVALGSDPMGQTALSCIVSIPLIALPIGALLFAGMRHRVEPFASQRGFATGLFAGAVSASIYAVHCFEDAPAFYLLWYTGGILLSGAIGHMTGKRLLGV